MTPETYTDDGYRHVGVRSEGVFQHHQAGHKHTINATKVKQAFYFISNIHSTSLICLELEVLIHFFKDLFRYPLGREVVSAPGTACVCLIYSAMGRFINIFGHLHIISAIPMSCYTCYL